MNPELNNPSIILPLTAMLRDVLDGLNKSGSGVVFICEKRKLIGLFTDGDVRRALLNGATLDSPVKSFLKMKFVSGKASQSQEENLKLLTEDIRHLPILDEAGNLIDLISWTQIWRMPIMEPSFGGNEFKYVADCIATTWISSQGHYVKLFEKYFAGYHQAPFALTTCNGTAALHLALVALGVGKGDEVIVPDFTFAASANAVYHAGAKPILVDVTPEHWTMDTSKLRNVITPRTKAIMPVHLYGHPCDMDPILMIAKEFNLYVVEDCAEALGAEYKGRKVGTFGDAGCFSFFSNKVITTGEGGMIITRDGGLADKMTLLRDHGMRKGKRYWHEHIGYNYRMTNLQAAVGLAQLEQIDRFLKNRQQMAELYQRELGSIEGITLPPCMPWAKNIYWLYSILIDSEETGMSRDQLTHFLAREGIETRRFFYPLHQQPPYRSDGKFPVTERLSAQGMSLPSSNHLKIEDVQRVSGLIQKIIKHQKVLGELKGVLP